MTHKIIFLNGPPRSGKDTAGGLIAREFGARLYKMSRPLKGALRELFNISTSTAMNTLEAHKDERVVDMFMSAGGDILSWREVQISLSEEWIKPTFGQDILGRLALRNLSGLTGTDYTVFTDTGFRAECIPIIDAYGADNCLLIHLGRKDCSFDGDSRGYIALVGVRTVECDNYLPMTSTDDAPITFGMQLAQIIRSWTGEEQE